MNNLKFVSFVTSIDILLKCLARHFHIYFQTYFYISLLISLIMRYKNQFRIFLLPAPSFIGFTALRLP